MNGVDHKDRDTADWTVSLKSNWWYLRIFYWLVDGIPLAAYSIVCALATDKNHKWQILVEEWGTIQVPDGLGPCSNVTWSWQDSTKMTS
jgi:hypothetical protein